MLIHMLMSFEQRLASLFPIAAITRLAREANVCGPTVPARVAALERVDARV
jgi:hypothetical protein